MAAAIDERIQSESKRTKSLRDALRFMVAWSARERRAFRIDGLRVRQRPQEHAMDHAEERRIDADTEREGRNRRGREARTPSEKPHGKLRVLDQLFNQQARSRASRPPPGAVGRSRDAARRRLRMEIAGPIEPATCLQYQAEAAAADRPGAMSRSNSSSRSDRT